MAPTTFHNWLAIATLALHLLVVARLIFLAQEHLGFGPEDPLLIIVAETALALLLIDGFYLSVGLGLTTRQLHHAGALATVGTNVALGIVINHSLVIGREKRARRYTLVLFTVNSILIFLAYWISVGASMGWWVFPQQLQNEMRR